MKRWLCLGLGILVIIVAGALIYFYPENSLSTGFCCFMLIWLIAEYNDRKSEGDRK